MRRKRLQKSIARKDKERSLRRAERKQAFIEKCYQEGGKPALEAIKRYGKTESGTPLQWTRIFEELILLTADLRIGLVVFTGNAQGGKTMSQTLCFVYFVSEGQINCAWIYDTATNLNANMPVQFQRVAEAWIYTRYQEAGFDIRKVKHLNKNQNRRRFMIGNGMAVLTYASTSAKKDDGKAAIGSVGASFQSSINFEEEKSQWPNGVDMDARLEASVFETKPVRMLGTPGSGAGIERDVAQCEYHFYPHCDCPHCGDRTILDPKGALLKEFDRLTPSGEIIKTYFSVSGRPQAATQDTEGNATPARWFHHDPADPVKTAYVACTSCHKELTFESRTDHAYLACRKTGITAQEFLDSLPPGAPTQRLAIAQQISPLIRFRPHIATEVIALGLNPSKNPQDWQQQVLGHPSEIMQTGLTFDIIQRSVEAVYRPTKFDVVLAGLDQGTSQHWLWIAGVRLPPGFEKMTIDQVIDQALQVVLFAEPISASELSELLEKYGVDYGIIDNEPGRDWAESACADSPLEMADQKANLQQPAVMSTVESGSTVHDCWKIRYERFMSAVINGFYNCHTDKAPLIRAPQAWAVYTDPGVTQKHEYSPVQQLTGPSFDITANKWQHGAGGKDDLFYAAMFEQAALYIWLKYKRVTEKKSTIAVSSPQSKAKRPASFFNAPKRSNIRFR